MKSLCPQGQGVNYFCRQDPELVIHRKIPHGIPEIQQARARAELGARSLEQIATLRMLAFAATRAVLSRYGTGVSTQWTLSSMPADGVPNFYRHGSPAAQVAKGNPHGFAREPQPGRMIAGRALQAAAYV